MHPDPRPATVLAITLASAACTPHDAAHDGGASDAASTDTVASSSSTGTLTTAPPSTTAGSDADAGSSSTAGSSDDGASSGRDDDTSTGSPACDCPADEDCDARGVCQSLAWVVTHDGDAHGDDRALGVAIAADDAVVVVGVVDGGDDVTWDDAWIRKYDRFGHELWTVVHDGDSSGFDEADAVAIDSDDSILVAGVDFTYNVGLVWVRRYDPDGVESTRGPTSHRAAAPRPTASRSTATATWWSPATPACWATTTCGPRD